MDGEEEDKMSTTTGSSDTGHDRDSEKGPEGESSPTEAEADGHADADGDGDNEENEDDDEDAVSKEGATAEVGNQVEQSGQLFKSQFPSPSGKLESDQEPSLESIEKKSASENDGNSDENNSKNKDESPRSEKKQEKRKNVVQDLSSPVPDNYKESVSGTALCPQFLEKLASKKGKGGIEGEKEEETDLLDTTRTDREFTENTPRENLIISFATLSLKSTGKSDILNSLSKSLDYGMDTCDPLQNAIAESHSRVSSRRNSATSGNEDFILFSTNFNQFRYFVVFETSIIS